MERVRRDPHAGRPVPVGDLVAAWRRRHPRGGILADLRRRWRAALGEPWGRLTWPVSYRAGRLKVAVAGSAVLQELATLRSAEFLARVQAVEPRVVEARFAVGDGLWDAPEGEGRD